MKNKRKTSTGWVLSAFIAFVTAWILYECDPCPTTLTFFAVTAMVFGMELQRFRAMK